MIIALVTLLAYITGFLLMARIAYARSRPSRVPLCGKVSHGEIWAPKGSFTELDEYSHVKAGKTASEDQHHMFEYNRGEIPSCFGDNTENNAVRLAVLNGALWPFLLPWAGVRLAITAKPKMLPGEQKALLAKAEADLARVTADLEKLRENS
jgi:hypothetical protein